MKVIIHNISNYYSSYYLLGLIKVHEPHFSASKEFSSFNNRGYIVFEINGKLGVIDNHDPIGVNEELYEKSDFYFVTNKVKGNPSYERERVFPLFPHYPIDVRSSYLKLFGAHPFLKLKPIDFLKELYAQSLRPLYNSEQFQYHGSNYVFFSGSIWKKEPLANQLRATFIQACKDHPMINFEGGFVERKDGQHGGYDHLLNTKKYKPREFASLSRQSRIIFNNPAVLGAVSWRLAESQNLGSFVLSFPFDIHLPKYPLHGEEIHMINSLEEISESIDYIMKNDSYHQKISKGGKLFFDKYCTPEKQINFVLNYFQ